MAKKHKQKARGGSSKAPASRMEQALAAGDNREARHLAQRILSDGEADEAARMEAREVLGRLRIDPLALAFVFGGLVLWAVIFLLGVVGRH